MAIYECRKCEKEQYAPRRFRYHLGPSCRCPICGTYRVVRLKAPDKIDRKHGGFLNLVERLAGQGPDVSLPLVPAAIFDRRPLADRRPHRPDGLRPHWCRKWRRLPAPLNSVIFQAESPDAGQRLDNWLNARLPDYSRSRIQDWIKSGPCAGERRCGAPFLHTAGRRDHRRGARRTGPATGDARRQFRSPCCTKTQTWWPSISLPAW